jgi:cell division protein FtsB
VKRILFFVVFLAVLAGFAKEGWVKLYRLSLAEASLTEQNRTVSEQNDKLRRDITHLNDGAYLERLIRRDLGFIHDQEIVFERVE